MSMQTDVAVIGSGFSAVALSLNLVELLPPTARISLVGAKERTPPIPPRRIGIS